jgi:hypothetical protein
MLESFLLPLGGDLNNFNIWLYSANIGDMTDMDDDYILRGHCHA